MIIMWSAIIVCIMQIDIKIIKYKIMKYKKKLSKKKFLWKYIFECIYQLLIYFYY